MDKKNASGAALVGAVLALAVGCGNKSSPPPATPLAPHEATTTTSAETTTSPTANNKSGIGVSDEIAKACNLHFSDVKTAPKFEFDRSNLPDEDRNVLDQIAACLATGPLRGRAVTLVGRADPRGEEEYNMALGEHRADSVRSYLERLGVGANQLKETSRGKLDATGTDEESWRRDRRVDINLR